MKPDTRSTILYPKRLSAMTHGHFVADEHGMSFRFHIYLNPQSVYGAMLRLEQASWLDKFDDIVCEEHEDVWEVRKRFPKVAFRVRYVLDSDQPEDRLYERQLYVVNGGRSINWHETDAWVMLSPNETVQMDDLAPVATITSSYR